MSDAPAEPATSKNRESLATGTLAGDQLFRSFQFALVLPTQVLSAERASVAASIVASNMHAVSRTGLRVWRLVVFMFYGMGLGLLGWTGFSMDTQKFYRCFCATVDVQLVVDPLEVPSHSVR